MYEYIELAEVNHDKFKGVVISDPHMWLPEVWRVTTDLCEARCGIIVARLICLHVLHVANGCVAFAMRLWHKRTGSVPRCLLAIIDS